MYLLGKIRVTSIIPERFSRLNDIAYNLWWSWNSEALSIFKEIDETLWSNTQGNPVRFLHEVSPSRINAKVNDDAFMKKYDHVVEKFDSYMSDRNTWFNKNFPSSADKKIAYFSAEYGLSEVLPVYSGGLGVLSGDHCKSASDLGIPLTAIGLFYKQGYFEQRINGEGWQETIFTDLNQYELPVKPVLDNNGSPVLINVELPGRLVYAMLWKVQIGRISLYLMDTDIENNNNYDRHITSRLYGGDQETRIQQEMILGIGGIRALEALGIKASVYHMNEGHSSFLGLELIRKLINENNMTFYEAKEAVSASTVFTTHTPVPAGNDVFPFHMIDRYFGNYWPLLGISRHEFLDLGLKIGEQQNFNMTVLALTIAGKSNGVSELHGAVSRNIFKSLWPGVPEHEVPITHITNGIHTFTWAAQDFRNIYKKYLGIDETSFNDAKAFDKVDSIPDKELWDAHCSLKKDMINYVSMKLKEQWKRNGIPFDHSSNSLMPDPNALTIGFARRFATYKRANLIFRDAARIQKILNKKDTPVQIIFAGKAHPADHPAHEIIKNIYDIAREEGFKGKVFILENYNMSMARYLVQGVDIWMNNPRRPLEASGTSGQKVCVNGILNFSILDGWWCEGYNGRNGWSIGDNTNFENEYFQDNSDSVSIYQTLENEIIPMFYERDASGVPVKWVQMMKETIKSLVYSFSTHRMLKDYTELFYNPSMEKTDSISADNYRLAKEVTSWKEKTHQNWAHLNINAEKSANLLRENNTITGQPVTLSAHVSLGDLKPENINVEVYYGAVTDGTISHGEVEIMTPGNRLDDGSYNYYCDVVFSDGGEYGYTFRIIPNHPALNNKFDTGLIKWIV